MTFLFYLVTALVSLAVGGLLGYLVATLRRKEVDAQVLSLQQQNDFLKLQMQAEEQRWQERQKQLEERFEQLSRRILDHNTDQLKTSSKEQLSHVLQPLREQLDVLRKAVSDTNTGNATARTSIETLVKQLMERADGISKDASNLTRALKGDSKMQGDWGEMVLSRLLESSGLHQGNEFSTQCSYKDKEGNIFRPDVVVHLPENRHIIIDSKVSLTAYARLMELDAEAAPAEREAVIKAHVDSVRKHIQELAGKDYAAIVPGAIGHVLMFMPNESAYIGAVQAQPSLVHEAYESGVLLISPTNLLMALQLASNLWQKERQSRNVRNIIDRAESLYKKCATLDDSMEKIKRAIDTLSKAYEQARGQFKTGNGNLVRQIEDLRSYGINPSRRLSLEEVADGPEEEL